MNNDQWKLEFFKMLGDVKKWMEATAFKQQHLPPGLFKYRAISEYSLKDLTENSIWLNNPNDFNDPYDSSFNLNYSELFNIQESDKWDEKTQQAFDKLSKEQQEHLLNFFEKIKADRDAQLVQEFNKGVKDRYHKVFSFSGRKDSILMWSHYANNHKGICIEYEASEEIWGGSFARKKGRLFIFLIFKSGTPNCRKYTDRFCSGRVLVPIILIVDQGRSISIAGSGGHTTFQLDTQNIHFHLIPPVPTV